jgi:hypothetical protein
MSRRHAREDGIGIAEPHRCERALRFACNAATPQAPVGAGAPAVAPGARAAAPLDDARDAGVPRSRGAQAQADGGVSGSGVACSASGIRSGADACLDPRCATLPEAFTRCATDADCAVIPTTAIECAGAGPFVSVRRGSENEIRSKLRNEPDRGRCGCTAPPARCVGGACGFEAAHRSSTLTDDDWTVRFALRDRPDGAQGEPRQLASLIVHAPGASEREYEIGTFGGGCSEVDGRSAPSVLTTLRCFHAGAGDELTVVRRANALVVLHRQTDEQSPPGRARTLATIPIDARAAVRALPLL